MKIQLPYALPPVIHVILIVLLYHMLVNVQTSPDVRQGIQVLFLVIESVFVVIALGIILRSTVWMIGPMKFLWLLGEVVSAVIVILAAWQFSWPLVTIVAVLGIFQGVAAGLYLRRLVHF